ncbi:MAG TPA: energy transducer TonB [Nitrococcus sp.]|nr:energy transducer TonB [Nitrococcus sp.]
MSQPPGLAGPPFAITLTAALIIELGLMIGVVLSLAPIEAQRPTPAQPFQVSLVPAPAALAQGKSRSKPAAPPPVLKAPQKPPPKPHAEPKLQPTPKPKPKPKPISRRRHTLESKPRLARVEKSSPVQATSEMAPSPAAPARSKPRLRQLQPSPSPSAAEISHLTASFKEQVRAAVLSATSYPRAARMLGLEGQAEIAFDFRDGQVSNVHIARSSNAAVLDQAALRAVRMADYPSPPPELEGKRLQFRIVIRFRQS